MPCRRMWDHSIKKTAASVLEVVFETYMWKELELSPSYSLMHKCMSKKINNNLLTASLGIWIWF